MTIMINKEERAAARTEEEEEAAARGRVVKKGPWTAAEDTLLTEYVRKNGEGNWNAVQKNTGLARCGKSCRLRWANHLRPNLKKGSFSHDEEKIIIELHAKLGNKWARMASQLPGRTDNEIKNFWNTRMKRRQRAGLPLYPHDQLQELLGQTLQHNNSLNLTSHQHNHNHNPKINPIIDPTNNYNLYHPIVNSQVSQFVPSNNHQQSNNITMSPITSASPYSFQYSSGTLSSPGLVRLVGRELPSSQTPALSDDHMSGERCRFNDVASGQFDGLAKSGLLGDLVVEGRAMSRNKRARKMSMSSPEEREKSAVAREESEDGFVRSESALKSGVETKCTENRTENFSSGDQSSLGIEQGEDPIDMSSMDDDLMSLLNNFPSSTMPVPDWFSGGGDIISSRKMLAGATSGPNSRIDMVPQNASPKSPEGKRGRSLGSCYWNNMPGIC